MHCTLLYQMAIQIDYQISILRNWSEVKPRHAFSLELGSKGSKWLETLQKLACTFLYQTGIQIYDQISTSRIWSKVKLHHSISLRFGLKEGKMALINWKQMQPFRTWFHQVFLRSKIACNPLKVFMHGYLSNGYLNSLSNFNYKKAEKITSLRYLLNQP